MNVKIFEIKKKLLDVIQKESLTLKEAEVIADQYLDAELRGKKSHGLGKFFVELRYFKDRISKPKIIKEKGPVALVDANREIGQLSAV